MRILFALAGFHRYDRGAETALLAVAQELAASGEDVTVAGSGLPRADTAYAFRHVGAVDRIRFEKFPSFPALRNEMAYEDATFAFNLLRTVKVSDFDLTVTCSYPFTNWALRRGGDKAPPHVFVTENGDWPVISNSAEFRFFGCDGLVCTNPQYHARNEAEWNSTLIPNGIFPGKFAPGPDMRASLGLPQDKPIVLMVSAFMDTKRVPDGMRAVAALEDAVLVVAGDGPLRQECDNLAADILPGRFKRITLSADQMPDLYRSADVFLHMSKVESFGNVYVEAAATGLPVVAHDYDLTRWILGDNQFLCDSDNIENVAHSLRSALAAGLQQPDRQLDQFTWPTIAASYRKFFAKVVGERSTNA